MSGDRAQARRRTGKPPEAALFDAQGTPPGSLAACLSLPGLTIAVTGMDAGWQQEFLETYGVHAHPGARPGAQASGGGAVCTLATARSATVDHFITPPAPGTIEYVPLFIEVKPEVGAAGHWIVRACSYDIALSLATATASGTLLVSGAAFEPRSRGVENMLRVAVAWMARSLGGMLIHAASIVWQDRGYTFFGASGAGKSTVAASTRRGQVVSDDLSLLLPEEQTGVPSGLSLVGTPFRGTWTGGPQVTGRWPLAAAFHLNKAAPFQTPRATPMTPARAMAAMTGNLPFVVDQLAAHPGLMAGIEKALRPIPAFELVFRKDDDSYWEAITAAGL